MILFICNMFARITMPLKLLKTFHRCFYLLNSEYIRSYIEIYKFEILTKFFIPKKYRLVLIVRFVYSTALFSFIKMFSRNCHQKLLQKVGAQHSLYNRIEEVLLNLCMEVIFQVQWINLDLYSKFKVVNLLVCLILDKIIFKQYLFREKHLKTAVL